MHAHHAPGVNTVPVEPRPRLVAVTQHMPITINVDHVQMDIPPIPMMENGIFHNAKLPVPREWGYQRRVVNASFLMTMYGLAIIWWDTDQYRHLILV